MVVYEDNNTVFIGMTKPTALIGIIENNELSNIAADVEKGLKASIYEAK